MPVPVHALAHPSAHHASARGHVPVGDMNVDRIVLLALRVAKVLEIYDPWLRAMSDDEICALRDRLGILA
jgi:hypothetical protein